MKSTSKKFVFMLNPISSKFAEPKGKEKIDTIFSLKTFSNNFGKKLDNLYN